MSLILLLHCNHNHFGFGHGFFFNVAFILVVPFSHTKSLYMTWNESRNLWQLGLTWLSQSLWIWTWQFLFYVALRSRLTNTICHHLFWYLFKLWFASLFEHDKISKLLLPSHVLIICALLMWNSSSITHNLSPLVDSDKYWP